MQDAAFLPGVPCARIPATMRMTIHCQARRLAMRTTLHCLNRRLAVNHATINVAVAYIQRGNFSPQHFAACSPTVSSMAISIVKTSSTYQSVSVHLVTVSDAILP